MPHHSTAGKHFSFPVRINSRGYQLHCKKGQNVKRVLRGRVHLPFGRSREEANVNATTTCNKKDSYLQQPFAEVHIVLPANSKSSLFQTIAAARESLSSSSSVRHSESKTWTPKRVVDVQQDFDNFHEEREHDQVGMSPWNTPNTFIDSDSPTNSPLKSNRKHRSSRKTRNHLSTISMELTGLFAEGSRIDGETNSHERQNTSKGSNKNVEDGGHLKFILSDEGNAEGTKYRSDNRSRALSPFSEWLKNQRISSTNIIKPPMTADCTQSEIYQLHYNRASTVTASGGRKRRNKDDKNARKELNEERAQSLLVELKKVIKNKQHKKKKALIEQQIFKKQYDLREQIHRPLSSPKNCQLPLSFAPNHHCSHPSFTCFYPKSLNESKFHAAAEYSRAKITSENEIQKQQILEGKQLAHARLASYRFNILNTPYTEDRKIEKRIFQEQLLNSRKKEAIIRDNLAKSFWSRLGSQRKAEKILSDTLNRVNGEISDGNKHNNSVAPHEDDKSSFSDHNVHVQSSAALLFSVTIA